MDEKTKKLKAAFEKFAIQHFGGYITGVLAGFSEEDGYHDQTINAMWIGFCGGVIEADCI